VDVATLRRLIAPVLERKGALKAILFGSFARGTADRRSDVDLLIVDDERLRYLDRLTKYFDELSVVIPQPLEVFVYTQSELADLGSRHFIKRALDEGQVIYERGKAGG
jgi:uncharacterized protein